MRLVSKFYMPPDGIEKHSLSDIILQICEDRLAIVQARTGYISMDFNVTSIYSESGNLIERYHLTYSRLYLVPSVYMQGRKVYRYAKLDDSCDSMKRKLLRLFCGSDNNEICHHEIYGSPSFGVDGTYAFFSNKERNRLTVVTDKSTNIELGVKAENIFVYNKNLIVVAYTASKSTGIMLLSHDGNKRIYGSVSNPGTRVSFCRGGELIIIGATKYPVTRDRSYIIKPVGNDAYYTAEFGGMCVVGMFGDYPIILRSVAFNCLNSLHAMVGGTYVRLYKFDYPVCEATCLDNRLAVVTLDHCIHIFDTTYNEDAENTIVTATLRDAF